MGACMSDKNATVSGIKTVTYKHLQNLYGATPISWNKLSIRLTTSFTVGIPKYRYQCLKQQFDQKQIPMFSCSVVVYFVLSIIFSQGNKEIFIIKKTFNCTTVLNFTWKTSFKKIVTTLKAVLLYIIIPSLISILYSCENINKFLHQTELIQVSHQKLQLTRLHMITL